MNGLCFYKIDLVKSGFEVKWFMFTCYCETKYTDKLLVCLVIFLQFLVQVTTFPQTDAFSRVESGNGLASVLGSSRLASFHQASSLVPHFRSRFMSTETNSVDSSQDSSIPEPEVPPRIKFKRLDKTARHIMQACDCCVVLNKDIQFFFLSFVKIVGIYIL